VIPIVLVGGTGRMGRAVQAAASESDDLRVVAVVGRDGSRAASDPGPVPAPAGYPTAESSRREAAGGPAKSASRGATPAPGEDADPLREVVRRDTVVIDFSSPEGFRRAARACMAQGASLVTGTTGLGPEDEALLDQLARSAPVLAASNFSLGVLALRKALAAVLEAVPADWDLEIIERHHRNKADSPSGTALALAHDAAARRGLSTQAFRYGRQGRLGTRPAGEIGIHALRGGTWVGEHTVVLAGPGETIELGHVAADRAAFAHGALAAARFVARARPGRYAFDSLASGRTP
jgi:4-hydroxy-tetrahydrodipicolinate reductase